MGKPKKTKVAEGEVSSTVSEAFSEIESLKDELQNWYDNLPEAFQNGTKGEALQEAIGNLEGDSEPTAPDCVESLSCSYTQDNRGSSRRIRRDNCVAMLDGAIDTCNGYLDTLDTITYKEGEDGSEEAVLEGTLLTDEDNPEDWPLTKDDMESRHADVEQYISELEDAKSNWENTEFPSMYG